jgi:hypothetical protein
VYEVKIYLEDVSAGIGFYFKSTEQVLQFEVKVSEVNFDLAWYN